MIYPNRIIAIDLETTGLSSQYDYIVQVGAIVMENGEPASDPFYSRVQPSLDKLKISTGALAAQAGDVTTKEGRGKVAEWLGCLYDSPPSRDVAESFLEWAEKVGSSTVPTVAHNAAFDYGFFSSWQFQQKAAFKHRQPISPVWIDTIAMARLAYPGGRSYALDEVLLLCSLPPRPTNHDALQDALLCGQVYFKLRDQLLGNTL